MIARLLEKIKLLYIRMHDSSDNAKLRKYYQERFDVCIGKYTYGYRIQDIGKGSTIGAFCSIASGVKIGLMNHPMNFVSTHPFLYYKNRGFIAENRDISLKIGATIEDDVWIGNNAVILPGVTCGKGSVIAAGAVVTKDVAPYEVVGGVPSRHLKWRFTKEVREKLITIDYANWSDDEIKENLHLFYNVDEFIKYFGEKQ